MNSRVLVSLFTFSTLLSRSYVRWTLDNYKNNSKQLPYQPLTLTKTYSRFSTIYKIQTFSLGRIIWLFSYMLLPNLIKKVICRIASKKKKKKNVYLDCCHSYNNFSFLASNQMSINSQKSKQALSNGKHYGMIKTINNTYFWGVLTATILNKLSL